MMHTPGPWYVGAMNDCLFVITQPPSPSGSDVPIDTPHPGQEVIVKVDGDNSGANARLIAAAPELLEALKDARDCVFRAYECSFPDQLENERILAAVYAAIAKAEGK